MKKYKISHEIPNKENKLVDLVKIYKFCPISGKNLDDCTKIDIHHLFSQYSIITYSEKIKYAHLKSVMGGFIHCILNIVPTDHDKHINGSIGISYSIEEFKKIINYLNENKDLVDDLNFDSNRDTTVTKALMVFEVLDLKPIWFEKFM